MTKNPRPPDDPAPWSEPVTVDDIPEAGTTRTLTPDASTRAGLARLAGVRAIPDLKATFTLTPLSGGRIGVAGTVAGTIEQTCVVSLEPLTAQVDEAVDLVFDPRASLTDPVSGQSDDAAPDSSATTDMALASAPEPLEGGRIDLGVLATEFLVLGIDPYPRKPGATFEAPKVPDDPESHPFAALASLKKGTDPSPKG